MSQEQAEMLIRSLRPEDSASLQALHGLFGFDSWVGTDFSSLLANAELSGLMAENKAGPVGFLVWRQTGAELEILNIGVIEACRRTGTGARLLMQLVDLARKMEQPLILEVAEDNSPAIRFYSRFQFDVVGKRRNYYRTKSGDKVTALLMRRN